MKKKKSQLFMLCFRCHKPTKRTVDHSYLTSCYERESRNVPLCQACEDSIEFNREIIRQMREMTASEDELISGDFED
jgi:hypothetical protein